MTKAEIEQRLQARFRRAVKAGRVNTVAKCLSEGAKVNFRYHKNVTALYEAAQLEGVEVLQLLIEHGADPRVATKTGQTPLHAAATHGRRQHIQPLLEAGVERHARDDLGRTALHCATDSTRDTVLELVCQGLKLEARNTEGDTPLLYALAGNNPATAAALIEAGADIHATTRYGHGVLHLAVFGDLDKPLDERPGGQGRAPLTTLLLEAGADPNARSQDGETPFRYGCAYMVAESAAVVAMMELLHRYGADLSTPDNAGRSAMEILRETFADDDLARIEAAALRTSVPHSDAPTLSM